MLTEKDLLSSDPFEDTIAVFPDLDRGEESEKHPLTFIPYRSLVPKGVENMLVACRAFSSDQIVNNFFNLIPHCIALGEAAGTASALAIRQGVTPRKVSFEPLRKRLLAQNVPLPGALGRNERKSTEVPATYRSPRFGQQVSSRRPEAVGR
jgi:hypothetical protein